MSFFGDTMTTLCCSQTKRKAKVAICRLRRLVHICRLYRERLDFLCCLLHDSLAEQSSRISTCWYDDDPTYRSLNLTHEQSRGLLSTKPLSHAHQLRDDWTHACRRLARSSKSLPTISGLRTSGSAQTLEPTFSRPRTTRLVHTLAFGARLIRVSATLRLPPGIWARNRRRRRKDGARVRRRFVPLQVGSLDALQLNIG